MLVLHRREGEVIWIGDDIQVTVVHIDKEGVRIGVDALPEIPIHRDEVRRQIRGEQPGGN